MADSSEISASDIIIAVMGVTGCGKTSFISTLLGRDVGIGHGLRSATTAVSAFSFIHPSGQRLFLVDTPGFDDTELSDADVLREIAFVFSQTYKRNISLAGIVYLQRITDIRVPGSTVRMLNVLMELCGAKAFPHIILASTMWKRLVKGGDSYATGVEREKELKHDFWTDMCDGGSQVMRWDGSRDSAMSMVDYLIDLQSRFGGPKLQIQEEIVDMGRCVIDTKAGKVVNDKLIRLRNQFDGELSRLKDDIAKSQWEQSKHEKKQNMEQQRKLEEQLSDSRKAEEDLRVDFERLSAQKLSKYEGLITEYKQRLQQTQEAIQAQEQERTKLEKLHARDEGLYRDEEEYAITELKELDLEIERLTAVGDIEGVAKAKSARQLKAKAHNEFIEEYEEDQSHRRSEESRINTETARLKKEEDRLGKVDVALRAFGLLVGVGLTVAGAVTMNPILISGGIAMASASASCIMGVAKG